MNRQPPYMMCYIISYTDIPKKDAELSDTFKWWEKHHLSYPRNTVYFSGSLYTSLSMHQLRVQLFAYLFGHLFTYPCVRLFIYVYVYNLLLHLLVHLLLHVFSIYLFVHWVFFVRSSMCLVFHDITYIHNCTCAKETRSLSLSFSTCKSTYPYVAL